MRPSCRKERQVAEQCDFGPPLTVGLPDYVSWICVRARRRAVNENVSVQRRETWHPTCGGSHGTSESDHGSQPRCQSPARIYSEPGAVQRLGEKIAANSSPERVVFFLSLLFSLSEQFYSWLKSVFLIATNRSKVTLKGELVVEFNHVFSAMGTIHHLMHPGIRPNLKGSLVTFEGAHQLIYLVVQ